ncbi:peptidase inhibitor family I36 protein [Actinosynnema sp. NPDC047251]|uniref:Putative secreted protein n=1 Tax=Saccharothrix espanaensis (strain ATCC 51144 / DSM 44229 / JCM 9112 / NBRC 15066 / NRRL 15764) TaxID=1179773 RepID=K0K734_SACES|nr:peptidase inhibitor family I36 protein [Saccharothrix espanaensis]CCH32709.1 putative secreted protein [Saccharothrix espanaensis DSM 44229]
MGFARKSTLLGAVLAAVLGLTMAAGPAGAAGKNGSLESGEFGLYYLTGQSGWVFDLYVSDSNFADDNFPGTGVSADNNTESYRNRDSFWWHVFTGAGYTGSHGCLSPGYVGNASATYKNTISSAYYSSSSC